MKNNIFLQVSLTICALLIVSCSDDLNQNPTDPDLFTEVDVYSSPQQALSALAKVYSGLAVTGQQGPAGQPDIDGSITKDWKWPLDIVLRILKLSETGQCVMSFNDQGLLQIIVDSGMAKYTYLLPAKS